MQTDIQTRGFSLTKSIREYTLRRLNSAVNCADHHIRRVTVRLSDINGVRGGVDKRCQLMFTLPHMPSVLIEDVGHDLYVAIDRAAERASVSLVRQIERRKRLQFTSRHLALGAVGSE